MTIQAIRVEGDPVLRLVCEPITDFSVAPALAQDLYDTAKAEHGGLRALGLAANQIGVSMRAILVGSNVYFNPEIIQKDGYSVMEEMCFSQPGRKMKKTRSKRVVVRYQTETGESKTCKAINMLAHVFQHEIDHLDGILMTDSKKKDVG